MPLLQNQIPQEVIRVCETLRKHGFEAWIVGGCVRDLIIGKEPNDWDVTTNANPEQIQTAFENTFYTNDFGTVGVVNEDVQDARLKIIEVTPYRLEGAYSDARRPDSVSFSQKINDDLQRRDFTINAMAYNPTSGELIDVYGGIKDIKDKIVRAVGEPHDRFAEDALRILRAIRIAAELDFSIEPATQKAIQDNAFLLQKISRERVRDELVRILMSSKPRQALTSAQTLGLLPYVLPELEEGMGIEQNQAHSFDVFEHSLRALQHAADKGWDIDVRLAALLHDIGKPKSRRHSEEKGDWTFHGHEVVGARMTKKILENLRFSREIIEKVTNLVRWHMFFSDPDKVTLSAVRRIVVNVGKANIWDLINLRICDRIGTGRPKEQPFRLRKYQAMIEQALRDPISVGMLKIDGKRIMDVTRESPGPRLGWMLHALLEEVLEDPSKNTAEYLEARVLTMAKLDNSQLQSIGAAGKERKAEAEQEEIKDIQKKYYVD